MTGTTTLLLFVLVLCLVMLLISPAKPLDLALPELKPRLGKVESEHEAIDDLKSGDEARGFLAKGAKGLLFLHAPWCGHCKVMMPAFEAAAVQLKAQGFAVARIQAEHAGQAFLAAMNVRGFPTLLGVHEGATTPYEGARTTDELVKFVQSL